ncbi:hypothetical protein TIFTF001_003976 [Ficus carica]|uniref:Uncharacterized protein n=1 Tax=Ficus carica TaxID=3494 RepID=A0AA87ZBA0_FICCA|nr:hypothetical protein TIFTF001_003976 [Ficus carica]
MAYEITEQKKIGLGLIGFGIFFSLLGVILFFDKGLLALGNIFWLSGVAILLGWRSTLRLFTNQANYKLEIPQTRLVGGSAEHYNVFGKLETLGYLPGSWTMWKQTIGLTSQPTPYGLAFHLNWLTCKPDNGQMCWKIWIRKPNT